MGARASPSQSNESLHLLLRVADEICADFDLLRSWPERALSQLFVNLEPLLATIRSALFLGEVITPLQAFGGAVMIAALVAFQLRR